MADYREPEPLGRLLIVLPHFGAVVLTAWTCRRHRPGRVARDNLAFSEFKDPRLTQRDGDWW
jgi:hypothetical protein